MEPLQHGDPKRVRDYCLVARLGTGGMGVVYLGRSPAGRAVAVKVIRPRFAGDAGYRARFRREAAAARRVTGAFTAPVLDADVDATEPWLVTAYLPGMTLREAISTFGRLPPAAVITLAASLAEALADIHSAGLTHRDLKPSNIMVTPTGPRVIDFGIARPEDATAITRVGTVLGTPGFMAPEQAQGAVAGPASDIFALGAVLVFAATGRRPFGAGGTDAVLKRVATAAVDLAGIEDFVLLDLLTACLRVEPEERPSTAALLDRLGHTADAELVVRWLPTAVTETIERRAASARLMVSPSNEADQRSPLPTPAASSTIMDKTTLNPSISWPVHGPRRVNRRAVLLGGGVTLVAAAGVATGIAGLTGDDKKREPEHGAAPITTRPTAPTMSLREWRVRVSNSSLELYIAGGAVIASVRNGGIRALDLQTGGLMWQCDADSILDVAKSTAFLVHPTGRRISAVDAATGALKWSHLPSVDETPRTAVIAGNTKDVVCVGTHKIRALSAADGQSRWTALVLADRGFIAAGDVLVCANVWGVTGVDVNTGKELWTVDTPEQPTDPRAANGMTYVSDAEGTIWAVRARDGAVLWQQPGLGASSALLLAADKGAMYYSADGEIRAYTSDTGHPLWTRPIGRRTGATHGHSNTDNRMITLAGDTLYALSNDGYLCALDITDGSVRWDLPDLATACRVAVSDGLVFVATADGYVQTILPPHGG